MPRIVLVVTGDLERIGLADSLQRVFPQADFAVDALKRDSFTSSRVRVIGDTETPKLVDKLAAALVAAVDPGRSGKPADLAFVVEDLELANLDQPQIVVAAFRDAVLRHVDKHWSSEVRRSLALKRLHEKASFHLLAPMTEAYFFAAAEPLKAAGVASPAILKKGHDLEDFTVDDPAYLQEPVGSRSWARAAREKHPKRYLQYLLDPSEAIRYRETKQGVAALASTNWLQITAIHSQDHLRFLRSMIVDLAMGLGLPIGNYPGQTHPVTWLDGRKVLRNI